MHQKAELLLETDDDFLEWGSTGVHAIQHKPCWQALASEHALRGTCLIVRPTTIECSMFIACTMNTLLRAHVQTIHFFYRFGRQCQFAQIGNVPLILYEHMKSKYIRSVFLFTIWLFDYSLHRVATRTRVHLPGASCARLLHSSIFL